MAAKVKQLLQQTPLGGVITSPVIYGLVFPFLLLDLFVTIYQHLCFRVYGVPVVKRSEYIRIDRHDLPHVNWRDRLNCAYCDYAQGVLSYVTEVVSRTEHFWCPVKNKALRQPHAPRYEQYIDHADTEGYRGKLKLQREKCRACETGCAK